MAETKPIYMIRNKKTGLFRLPNGKAKVHFGPNGGVHLEEWSPAGKIFESMAAVKQHLRLAGYQQRAKDWGVCEVRVHVSKATPVREVLAKKERR
jgi:hypothetical protein